MLRVLCLEWKTGARWAVVVVTRLGLAQGLEIEEGGNSGSRSVSVLISEVLSKLSSLRCVVCDYCLATSGPSRCTSLTAPVESAVLIGRQALPGTFAVLINHSSQNPSTVMMQ